MARAAGVLHHIQQPEIFELGWARLADQFKRSHVRVRFALAAAALAAFKGDRQLADVRTVLDNASGDPSIKVRQLVNPTGNGVA